MDAGRPLRTIRVVWFGAEEPGGFGGDAYAKAHGTERITRSPAKATSAPTGSGGSARKLDEDATRRSTRELTAALAPLGITKNDEGDADGTDVGPTIKAGAPWISLNQDGTRYFDFHHTPDDTLDKIDPVQLRQNVAAWTAMLADPVRRN